MNTFSTIDIILLVGLILSGGCNIWLLTKKPATPAATVPAATDFDTVCEMMDKQNGVNTQVDTTK